jgi:hypothetical protein
LCGKSSKALITKTAAGRAGSPGRNILYIVYIVFSRLIFCDPGLGENAEWRGKPCVIRCDNGPEYISETTKTWTAKHGIEIAFIQPGQPQQNAYVERYNRTVRYDWLAHHLFDSLDEIQDFCPATIRNAGDDN